MCVRCQRGLLEIDKTHIYSSILVEEAGLIQHGWESVIAESSQGQTSLKIYSSPETFSSHKIYTAGKLNVHILAMETDTVCNC